MSALRTLMISAPLALCAAPAFSASLGDHGVWSASQETENGSPVCFMSAQPDKDEGTYTRRGDIFAVVTHRPAEHSIGVVSIVAGYTYKSGSSVNIVIDQRKSFDLFTQNGFAWARDAADDKALIAAMRNGNTMVVKGMSSRGTPTTDTYSLKGFTAAYKAISAACGVK